MPPPVRKIARALSKSRSNTFHRLAVGDLGEITGSEILDYPKKSGPVFSLPKPWAGMAVGRFNKNAGWSSIPPAVAASR